MTALVPAVCRSARGRLAQLHGRRSVAKLPHAAQVTCDRSCLGPSGVSGTCGVSHPHIYLQARGIKTERYEPGRHVYSDAEALGSTAGLDEEVLTSKAFTRGGGMKKMVQAMARDKYEKYSRVRVRERTRLMKPFRLAPNFSHEDGADVQTLPAWVQSASQTASVATRRRPTQVGVSVMAAAASVLTGSRRWGAELGYPDLKIVHVDASDSIRRVNIRWCFYYPEDATEPNLALTQRFLKRRLKEIRRFISTKVPFKYQPVYSFEYDDADESSAVYEDEYMTEDQMDGSDDADWRDIVGHDDGGKL